MLARTRWRIERLLTRFSTANESQLSCSMKVYSQTWLVKAECDMSVYQMSRLRINPGRLEDFLAHQDAIKEINQRYGLKRRQILRTSIGGDDTGEVVIVSEFDDYAAWARWSEERSKDPEYERWRQATPAANPDSPARLLSTVLMQDITR
jgi:heme-degrading monooxygenase HmoA